MKYPIDAYTMRARLVPAVIGGAPAFAFVAIFIAWGGIALTNLIAGTALIVLFGVFADVARRRGRAIEPAIIEKMCGLPTTVTLRHRDPTYDAATKSGFHAFIARKLGEAAPSSDEETADPEAADAFYERGTAWLRENTRNRKKFEILFNENVDYGFRRNLLGLKRPAFLINAVVILVCIGIFWYRWPVELANSFDARLLVVILIALIHAAYLALFVTEQGVFEASRSYARQLLLSTRSPHLNKDSKKSPAAPKTSRKRVSRPITEQGA